MCFVIFFYYNFVFIYRTYPGKLLKGDFMAKQGMKRPERTHTKERNDTVPVPEIQGKAKCGKKQARAIIAGTSSP